MRGILTLIAAASLIAIGCSTDTSTPTPTPTGTSTQTVDVAAERSSLMEADRSWYQDYSASDTPAEAFVAGMTDDAVLLPPDAPIARGREAIRTTIDALEGMPGFSVSWSPTDAEVSADGDLGYTIGTYQMAMEGPDGTPVRIEGKYLTVWRKQDDGSWAVEADMFNADGPPPAGQ